MADIIARDRWGALGEPGGYRIGHQVNRAIIHHTYRPHLGPGASLWQEIAAVQGIQEFHKFDRGWDDIGYQYLVTQTGRIFEGRGLWQTGAHTHGQNSKSIGICLVIDGDEHTPTDAAWAAAADVIRLAIAEGALAPDYFLRGHTDYAVKSCPGRLTYPQIASHLADLTIDDFEDLMSNLNDAQRKFLLDVAEQGVQEGVEGDSFVRELLKTHRASRPLLGGLRGFLEGVSYMDSNPGSLARHAVATLRELTARGLRTADPADIRENRLYTPDELGLDDGEVS